MKKAFGVAAAMLAAIASAAAIIYFVKRFFEDSDCVYKSYDMQGDEVYPHIDDLEYDSEIDEDVE